MDPYLEQYWRDIHHGLITYARDQIQPILPDDLRARVEQRVFLETGDGNYRTVYPDVHLVEHHRAQPARPAEQSTLIADEPMIVPLLDEPMTEGYLEIIDVASGNRVVTVIEFLSPTNKAPGPGMDLYVEKQKEVLAAGASLAEIDLTRLGMPPFVSETVKTPVVPATIFRICVRRSWKRRQAELYVAMLRERLPVIRIPLRESDKDVPLDLQALVDQCYHNGRYDSLDYRLEPNPPLRPDDAAWADEMLRAQGRR
jgi:hypothetical protein